jgi:hypothetical protein
MIEGKQMQVMIHSRLTLLLVLKIRAILLLLAIPRSFSVVLVEGVEMCHREYKKLFVSTMMLRRGNFGVSYYRYKYAQLPCIKSRIQVSLYVHNL